MAQLFPLTVNGRARAQICLALWMIAENIDHGSAALDAEFPYWKKPEVISRVKDTLTLFYLGWQEEWKGHSGQYIHISLDLKIKIFAVYENQFIRLSTLSLKGFPYNSMSVDFSYYFLSWLKRWKFVFCFVSFAWNLICTRKSLIKTEC